MNENKRLEVIIQNLMTYILEFYCDNNLDYFLSVMKENGLTDEEIKAFNNNCF